MKYPTAPRRDLIETLHGVAVADPFRRLESDDDPETVAWVAAQNAETRRLLDSPLRDVLAARLRELHRVPRASVPAVRGNRIFFTEHDGVRAQAVLCVAGAGDWALRAGQSGLEARRTAAAEISSRVAQRFRPVAESSSPVAQGSS